MHTHRIAVVGLGYVGLPLAIAFAEKYRVIGFDISEERITQLSSGEDQTQEVDTKTLSALVRSYQNNTSVSGIHFTADPAETAGCNIYIIAVPTPVDQQKAPDLHLFKEATKTVASVLKKKDIVIYESTVFPGCTEEIGVPILEQYSGLRFNTDFFCGYSPERINPGDRSRTIVQIRKITSGSTPEVGVWVDELYRSVITAGTYLAPSIKIAEAAKVIENTQRDVNIAFVNELSKIFSILNIDTQEVLKAAATKWNFLPFQPGLVGGHCIGIDPYYLADKAIASGYIPEMILAARKINDSMGEYVAGQVLKLMAKKQVLQPGARVLIMGITFKENFSDVRNSKVIDIITALQAYALNLTVYDPWASPETVEKEYGITSTKVLETTGKFAAVIVAVNHTEFISIDYKNLLLDPGVLYDVKSILKHIPVDAKL